MKIIKTNKIFSKKIATRLILFFVSFVIVVATPIQMSNFASATPTVSELQAQIDALEVEIERYHAEAAKLNEQAQTLNNAIAKLSQESAIIQAQIDIYQSKYNQLIIKIEDTENKIQNSKDALGTTIADLYVGDDITPIEMLASSGSISEYLDKQEYKNSVRDQLAFTIKSIKSLKAELEKQKKDVKKVLDDQKNAKKALNDKVTQQQYLLEETQGQETAYQQISADGESKKKELIQQQQDIIWAAQHQGGTVTGISDPTKGDYPWGGGGCYVAYDSWGNLVSYNGLSGDGSDPLGYACRQCTSYAAWKVLEYSGAAYTYMGDAGNWPYSYPESMVHTAARKNSVGVISAGQYGHVVWVETDPDPEGYIIISQYNDYGNNTGDDSGLGWGNYSKVRVHKSTYDYYIYL